MEWKNIQFAPFKTFKEEYILCLDTLGQDRTFTDDEKRFALETIQEYKQAWEDRENAALSADRDRKLAIMGVSIDPDGEVAEASIDDAMRDAIDAMEMDPDYFIYQLVQDDAIFKSIYDNQRQLKIQAQYFIDRPDCAKVLANLKSFRVLKMQQII